MTSAARLRDALFALAATSSAIAFLTALLGRPVLSAVFAAAATVLISTALVAGYRRGSALRDAIAREISEQADAGRKLVIYERETGLFAHWYIALRCDEECHRSTRYERPLTLLIVEPSPEADGWKVHEQIADWLKGKLRASDIAGYFGNGRHIVLMPESTIAGVESVVARLHSDIEGAETGLSSCPEDGSSFEDLCTAARNRLGEVRQAA
jgi:hypothetical protein